MVPSTPRSTRRAHPPVIDELTTWLVAGGDERLDLDPATGLNTYGRTPLPPPDAIELGSCTMSAMSPLSLHATARVFQRLSRAPSGRVRAEDVEAACEANRRGLLAAFHLDDVRGVRVVFTPSGTDAELVPLALVAMKRAGRIRNIVVGPNEAGSGTVVAAGGRYPNELTPFGGRQRARSPVSEALAARVDVRTVAVREAGGSLRGTDLVDAEVADLVEGAVRRGGTAIVHRMAHSKTGVFAPTVACLRRLQARHGDHVVVVVDAAQARIGASTLRRHLEDGDLVLLTGSKFYGGPPFSGVVLVPEALAPAPAIAPEGLSDYVSACDLPADWTAARAVCREHDNLGLCLRWAAALAEIERYRAVPRPVQRAVIAAFGDSVRRWLRRTPHVVLEASPPANEGPPREDDEPQEVLPTVFSFSLHRGQDPSRRALAADELKQVARSLGAGTPSGRFYLGQPVRLDPAGAPSPAVLRIAIGAPLVRTVAGGASRPDELAERTAWLDTRISALARELEALLSRD